MGHLPKSKARNYTINMKIYFLTGIVLLAALQSAVEAIFLGPIAVGVALGAIAVKKGLIVGSILSSGRTSHRNGRRYSSYSRTSHYRQSNDYYSHYTEPQVYYYSSNSYYNRGKRSVPDYNEEELSRMIREVTDTTMTDNWYLDMVEKDQDDCTKRMICEVAHKQDQRKRLSEVEKQILDIFGEGLSVDTSKTTAVFDFAAQAGKYWKRGGIGCEFFRRCETPVNDILAMIEDEIQDFLDLEQSFNNSKARAIEKLNNENIEIDNEVKNLRLAQ